MNDIIAKLPEMKSGNELIFALSVLPYYDENIRSQSDAIRLISLSDIYDIYIPSQMSTEIYSKLYLALLRSLQNKTSKNAVIQRNLNYQSMQNKVYSGVMGGTDSFLISGCSGIGKSQAISRALDLITANGIIETKKPYTKIIPCVVVQCPFDSSVKGLLLEILRKVDELLESNYYEKALKGRVTTDQLIGTISQVAINHISLIIVDEIQNVVNSKNGKSLVGMLTQLINSSGISIGMVGTPESTPFFEEALHLARRSLGLCYGALEYNQYFYDFCKTVWSYQYVRNISEITDAIVQWLYAHSNGIISVVISLIHDAQEIAILNGKEILNIDTLTQAYKKRLSLLHGYIELSIPKKSQTTTKKKSLNTYQSTDKEPVTDDKISIASIVATAKADGIDVVSLLQQHIRIEVIRI